LQALFSHFLRFFQSGDNKSIVVELFCELIKFALKVVLDPNKVAVRITGFIDLLIKFVNAGLERCALDEDVCVVVIHRSF